MSQLKRIMLLAMAALMVFLCSGMTVFAETDGGAAPTGTSTVKFTNNKATSVGISVHKEVECAGEGYTAPADAVFLFAINVNERLGCGQPYQYYNAKGIQVVRYYDVMAGQYGQATRPDFEKLLEEKPNLQEVDFVTDGSGRFRLQDQETVVFTGLEIGDTYEISEVDTETTDPAQRANFTQLFPADNGSHKGVVDEKGTSLTFRNRYEEKGGPTPPAELRSIRVVKHTPGISGYDVPFHIPSFMFRLEIGGEPAAKQAFMVLEAEGSQQYLRTGTTDEGGCFFLSGGQMALFEDMPQFETYRVEEVLTEKTENGSTLEINPEWWPLGETVFEDVLREDVLLDFTNQSLSFGVKKSLKDGSTPDTQFSFRLLNANGTGWEGVSYYICNTATGQLTEQSVTYFTGPFGEFSLRAGESAIFEGLRPGTVYSVVEDSTKGYVQVLPESTGGYRNHTVLTTPEILIFENDVQEQTSGLSVSKIVKSESAEFEADTQFWFRLLRVSGTETSVMADKTYSLNGGTYKTDAEGLFSMKSGETVNFQFLPTGATYQVEEKGVVMVDGSYSLEGYHTEPGTVQTGELTEDGLNLEFINYYNSAVPFKLTKVDAEDDTRKLSGAEFKLYKLLDNNEIDPSFQEVPLTTGTDGTAELEEIVSGRYALLETKAPTGYIAPEGAFVFEISVKNGTVTAVADVEGAAPAEWISGEMDTSGTIHVMVRNGFYRLPKTGGTDVAIFTMSGMLLLSLALVYWFLQKKYEIKKGRRV